MNVVVAEIEDEGILGIHNFHNGGSRTMAGVSCMETRSAGPEHRVALLIR